MRRLCSFHAESHGVTRRVGFLHTESRFPSRGESRSHTESLEASEVLETLEAPEALEALESLEAPEVLERPRESGNSG